MFCFSQNRVVSVEAILFEKALSIGYLHIKEGVTQAEKRVRWGGHGYLVKSGDKGFNDAGLEDPGQVFA